LGSALLSRNVMAGALSAQGLPCYEHVAGYGDDAVWLNVVWTVIGLA